MVLSVMHQMQLATVALRDRTNFYRYPHQSISTIRVYMAAAPYWRYLRFGCVDLFLADEMRLRCSFARSIEH